MEIKQKIRSQSVKPKKATRIKERGDIAVKKRKYFRQNNSAWHSRCIRSSTKRKKLIAQKTNGYGSVHESANETEYAVTYLEKASGHLKEKSSVKSYGKICFYDQMEHQYHQGYRQRKNERYGRLNVSFKAHPELLRQALFPLKQQQTKPAPQDGILFPLFAKHENMQNAPKPSSISQKEQPKGAKSAVNTLAAALKKLLWL